MLLIRMAKYICNGQELLQLQQRLALVLEWNSTVGPHTSGSSFSNVLFEDIVVKGIQPLLDVLLRKTELLFNGTNSVV